MEQAQRALKRLILCFDGTWNTVKSHTNVSRMYAAIADQHAGCEDQLKFYDAGVGTSAGSRVTGGALGWGLDSNILQGYCWLVNEYFCDGSLAEPEADGEQFAAGPDIFIFGFSRGAFTARSLAGLINRCGLVRATRIEPVKNALTKAVDARAHPESAVIQNAWALYRKEFDGPGEARLQPECVQFRAQNSFNVKVGFLGVWDTVGALGVPMFSKLPLARIKYGFHDTSLGRVIENAYHAVAVDEQREDYRVTLWDSGHPVGTRSVEQRWFPGAHANVGGGYEDDLLPDPPLKWMAEMALRYGLEFTDQFQMRLGQLKCKAELPDDFKLRGDEYLSPVRDSYREFLSGIYANLRNATLQGRYYRPMLVDGVNETIDETAHMKWAADPSYRPPNFAAAGRSDFTPSARGDAQVSAARVGDASSNN